MTTHDPTTTARRRQTPGRCRGFYTIQVEGLPRGKPAYFIRWAAAEADAVVATSPNTRGIRRSFSPAPSARRWGRRRKRHRVRGRSTGGSPCSTPCEPLTAALRARGLRVFLETSGAHPFSGSSTGCGLSPQAPASPLDESLRPGDGAETSVVPGSATFRMAEDQRQRACARMPPLPFQPEWSVAERIMPELVAYVKPTRSETFSDPRRTK